MLLIFFLSVLEISLVAAARRHVRKPVSKNHNVCQNYQKYRINRRHRLRENCAQIMQDGCKESGNYFIKIGNSEKHVYCDMETDGGGWTLIHQHGIKDSNYWSCYRRKTPCNLSKSENWNRTWTDYRDGFGGASNGTSDFWIGLETMYWLTKDTKPANRRVEPHYMSARINLIDWNGDHRHVNYDRFQIRRGDLGYAINLRGFTEGDEDKPVGNAFGGIMENVFCDSKASHKCNAPKVNRKASKQNGQMFSTIDRDNDSYCRPREFRPTKHGKSLTPIFQKNEEKFCESQTIRNCAVKEQSGFWFNSCSSVNLNGRIFRAREESDNPRMKFTDGMIWATWHKEYYALMFSNILLRPANFKT